MPGKSQSDIRILTGSQQSQSGIGIPASGPVRYRWSRISPSLPSYADVGIQLLITWIFLQIWSKMQTKTCIIGTFAKPI